MSEKAELMPCPFCGGAAAIEDAGGGHWTVGCNDGDAEQLCYGYQSLTTFARRADAITAWNTRPGWRDIKTAPRDGTRILAFAIRDGKPLYRVTWWRREGDASFIGWGEFSDYYWPCTHWVPLLPPPTWTGEKE